MIPVYDMTHERDVRRWLMLPVLERRSGPRHLVKWPVVHPELVYPEEDAKTNRPVMSTTLYDALAEQLREEECEAVAQDVEHCRSKHKCCHMCWALAEAYLEPT